MKYLLNNVKNINIITLKFIQIIIIVIFMAFPTSGKTDIGSILGGLMHLYEIIPNADKKLESFFIKDHIDRAKENINNPKFFKEFKNKLSKLDNIKPCEGGISYDKERSSHSILITFDNKCRGINIYQDPEVKGLIYDGQWENREPNGYGALFNTNGDIFIGYFEEFLIVEGTYFALNKEAGNNQYFYEGSFLNYEPHGKGVKQYEDGSIHKGEFSNSDLINGEIILANGKKLLKNSSEKFINLLEKTAKEKYTINKSIEKKEDNSKPNRKELASLSLPELILAQIRENWFLPPGIELSKSLRARIRISLDINGNVTNLQIHNETINDIARDSKLQLYVESAIRAIKKTSPFEGLRKDRYNIWKEVIINFNPIYARNLNSEFINYDKESDTILREHLDEGNEDLEAEAIAIEKEKIKTVKQDIERLKKEIEDLKEKNKEALEKISSDIDPPQIAIISSNVQNKRGVIEGIVLDNVQVVELTIEGKNVKFDNEGNFRYSTFVPQDGKELIIEATDSKGLSEKKVLNLQRKILTEKKINFAKLNPLNLKGKKNKNALALIIGIGKYNNAPEAKYADRDASFFADYAESVLGINKNNIKLISNDGASNFNIKKAYKLWLKGFGIPGKSDIYIFYAGHGLASIDGKELYLLPYDGEPNLLEDTSILRSEIFDSVKAINPKSVTVFLDACYSGQTREKDMIIADARPITIVPIESDIPENFTVFSASSGSEISGSLPEADHGLFSYFLMKGLEGDADTNNDNKITNGELHNYVRSNVTRQAVRLGREQTPQLQGDESRVLVVFN